MADESRSAELRRLVAGYQVSQAIHVAATLGIADLLADGPRSSADLADATGTHPRSLYRLLRALAAVGVFHEEPDESFSLSSLGECLRSDAADSVSGWAAFIGRPYYWNAWGHLSHSVQTGESAFRHLHHEDVWEYRARDAAESVIFDRAMSSNSRTAAAHLVEAYDFTKFRCIVDVGGGQGVLLAAILAHCPGVNGIVFDQPHVVGRADDALQAAGVADRCRIVSGNFFESVPEGGDAYVMRNIIHDWDDEKSITILKSCRRVMAADAVLLILDAVIANPNEDARSKFMDLNMLVSPSGQERTRDEFDTLLASAGFRLNRIVPTGGSESVVEAVPA